MGYLRDVTGGFQVSQWLMVGVSALMLAFTPFLQPYHLKKGATGRVGISAGYSS
jgi:cyanate permease